MGDIYRHTSIFNFSLSDIFYFGVFLSLPVIVPEKIIDYCVIKNIFMGGVLFIRSDFLLV